MLRGDNKAKERLKDKLASDEVNVKEHLQLLNKWDLLLWEYAQGLVVKRLKRMPRIATSADAYTPSSKDQCSAPPALSSEMKSLLGVHQPPGHKAPL